MQLGNLFKIIEKCFPKADGKKAVLRINGNSYPIHRIEKYCISTYTEDKETHPFSWFETLSCLKSLGNHATLDYLKEEVTITFAKKRFMGDVRSLSIQSVRRENDTLIIEGRYYQPGDHLLVEFENDYYPSYLVTGTVDTIEHLFTDDECIILKDTYTADYNGFIDIDIEEPIHTKPFRYRIDSHGHVLTVFSEEKWSQIQDDVEQFRILKKHLPLIKEKELVSIISSLNQRKTIPK